MAFLFAGCYLAFGARGSFVDTSTQGPTIAIGSKCTAAHPCSVFSSKNKELKPESLSRLDALYVSVGEMSTAGSSFEPVSTTARALAVVQLFIDIIVIAAFTALFLATKFSPLA